MTKTKPGSAEWRKALQELIEDEDEEILLADGFEEAVLGVVRQFTRRPLVCYDFTRCVDILIGQGMSESEAIEYMGFNVTGAWAGEGTPVFLYRLVEEDEG